MNEETPDGRILLDKGVDGVGGNEGYARGLQGDGRRRVVFLCKVSPVTEELLSLYHSDDLVASADALFGNLHFPLQQVLDAIGVGMSAMDGLSLLEHLDVDGLLQQLRLGIGERTPLF